jgi:hypothetical protein
MNVLRFMAVLTEQPLFALGPAAILLYLFWISRKRFILIAALLWFVYVPYEYGMKFRFLCSGECNIRIDLLLLYPLLALVSVISVVAFVAHRLRST